MLKYLASLFTAAAAGVAGFPDPVIPVVDSFVYASEDLPNLPVSEVSKATGTPTTAQYTVRPGRRVAVYTITGCGPCARMYRDSIKPLYDKNWSKDLIQYINDDAKPRFPAYPTTVVYDGDTVISTHTGVLSAKQLTDLYYK